MIPEPPPAIKKEEDTLHRDALLLIPKDIFYEVSFKENKAIGVVLERSGEWAITKLADYKETGVRIGSALTFVNGENVIFDSYQQTIERFRNWTPPLKLIFRMAPAKESYLKKKTTNGWKKYYYILNDGKLVYKNTDSVTESIIAEISLIGAAVSVMTYKEAGKKYCFKLLSGVQCLILHAHDAKSCREWAAILYHAVAIANGGKHIIEFERQRIADEEARQRLLEMQQVEAENAYIVELISKAMTSESIEELEAAIQMADSVGLIGEFIEYSREFLTRLVEDRIFEEQQLEAERYRRNTTQVNEEVTVEEEVEEVDDTEPEVLPVEVVVEEKKGSKWGPPADAKDLRTFYDFYVKRAEDGTEYINVMQFSTIWRMVTGERGNLFKEMQTFNK